MSMSSWHLSTLVATTWVTVATADNKTKPNILFLMTDQQRFDTFGWSTRGRRSLTPNFDQLGSEGVIMKSSWTSTPSCTPARAALLTGMNGWNNGLIGYALDVPNHYKYTYPQGLSEAGYLTKALGKNHFNKTRHGFQQQTLYDGISMCRKADRDGNCTEATNGVIGQTFWEWDDYDQWFSVNHDKDDPLKGLDDWNSWKGYVYPYAEYFHPTVWVSRNAVKFLTTYNESRPFFFKVSWQRPHSPYDPPQRVLDMVSEDDLPPVIQGGNWDAWYKESEECNVTCADASCADAWCGDLGKDDLTFTRRAYLANIVLIDEGVGQIVSALKEKDIYEDTWILFTSDHGDGQGDHYHFRKTYAYEFSAHVGMFVRWPENYKQDAGVAIQRGTFIEREVCTELRDVAHTFLDIGDALGTIPEGRFGKRDGKSLLCLLRDPSGQTCDYKINPGPWREYIDLEHSMCYDKHHWWSGLTDGHMKYIFYPDVTLTKHEELYNLMADPGEMTDLSEDASYADTLKMWRERLVELWEEQGRGDEWVKDGVLQLRTWQQSSIYSPNQGKA